MTEKKNDFLEDLKPISLKEMDAAALMNRVDTKFLVKESSLATVISKLRESHKVLEIDGERSFEYNTTYYDTESFFFLNEHLRGKKTRYKVRKRSYVSSNLNFLELKNKTNKGRTIKSRVKVDLPFDELNMADHDFLASYPIDSKALMPVINIDFKRFTLVSNNLEERLTIDRGLNFDADGRKAELTGLAIIELKQSKQTLGSISGQVLREQRIFPLSISKYCFGMLLTHDGLRYNRLKPRLLKMNKLTHGSIWNSAA